jgi:cell division protein FtsN
MADRRSLGIVGFVFGGVTAAVMLVAVMAVKNQLDSRAFDDARLPVIAAAGQSVIR